MNAELLIGAIFRHTTVLVAQIATSGGIRAPLAHVANQVFLDLAAELDAQGVSRKVSADMFGMALRAFLRKIQRLRESRTETGRSLWEAILSFVQERGVTSRREVFDRFVRDDEELVRGVLHDLTENGLAFRSGSGDETSYRAISMEEQAAMGARRTREPDELIWVLVYRAGRISRDALLDQCRIEPGALDAALARLVASHRVHTVESAPDVFTSDEFVIPLGQSLGWEAAVLDHYSALVRTVCARLGADAPPQSPDRVGGSTYTFDVWEGHPMADEVYGWLRDFRARAGQLRARLERYNLQHGVPDEHVQVLVYGGQCVTDSSRRLEEQE